MMITIEEMKRGPVTNEELFGAMETIRQYCMSQHDCNDCGFQAYCRDTPNQWDFVDGTMDL